MDAGTKSRLGQFLTPVSIAAFMASLFADTGTQPIRLLDAGAGVGTLTTAFLQEIRQRPTTSEVEVTAYEIDSSLRLHLEEVLAAYSLAFGRFKFEIKKPDFIEDSSARLIFGNRGDFTHAILNPPYKKINSSSDHRQMLRSVGIETVNLYSAFVALAIRLMAPGGQIVAIIPRSFCNGPYYRPFRELMLRETSIHRIHLFESREKAFSDDDVLQENVILHLEKNGTQGKVFVSTSTDDTFTDLEIRTFEFEQILSPNDREIFFHIPTSDEPNFLESSESFNYSLADLGIEVSTGPVVDFRLKTHISQMPTPGSVPLLYPGHFTERGVEWPKSDSKKPNAIAFNEATERWLFPVGFYAVVRRFSAKEERRRLYAGVVDSKVFATFDAIGFENHLNVFHIRKHGLDESIARGLAIFLNSTVADVYFRRFNGHTQVNATDLRSMRYPSREKLAILGNQVRDLGIPDQNLIDSVVESMAL
jgi:tRNA1(Val) A37 N6-methylase TrmN6